MVRQVAGRALRGRGAHADLPAVVHIPADEQLQRYAARLDVLGGVALRERRPTPNHEAVLPPGRRGGAGGQEKRVDPAPFVEWFDELAHRVAYAAFEVEHSSWVRSLERMNSVHEHHRPDDFRLLRHYVLAFHDSTFDVLPGASPSSAATGRSPRSSPT